MSDQTTAPPAPAGNSGWLTWPRLMELFQQVPGQDPSILEHSAIDAVQMDRVRLRIRGSGEEVRWRAARGAMNGRMPSSRTAPSDFDVWSVGGGWDELDGPTRGSSRRRGAPVPHRLAPWDQDGTLFCVEDVFASLPRELGQPFVLQGGKQAADQGPAQRKGGRPKSPVLEEAKKAVWTAMRANNPPDWASGWREKWPPDSIAAIARALMDWLRTYSPKESFSESSLDRAARELDKRRNAV